MNKISIEKKKTQMIRFCIIISLDTLEYSILTMSIGFAIKHSIHSLIYEFMDNFHTNIYEFQKEYLISA